MSGLGTHATPRLLSYQAGEDLNTVASHLYRFVKFDTTALKVKLWDGSGEIAGILMSLGDDGQNVSVAGFGGGAKLRVGAGVTPDGRRFES